MKLYELTYIPVLGLSQDEQAKLCEKIISTLEIQPTSQFSSGFLSTVDFNSEPEKIQEIEEKLKIEPQIQRYLILKKTSSRIKARTFRRTEFSKRIEKETNRPKVELQEIEKKLDEILKD